MIGGYHRGLHGHTKVPLPIKVHGHGVIGATYHCHAAEALGGMMGMPMMVSFDGSLQSRARPHVATFCSVHELLLKIVQALMVCRCYSPQEDVGQPHVVSAVQRR
jgi:hypothetical protein